MSTTGKTIPGITTTTITLPAATTTSAGTTYTISGGGGGGNLAGITGAAGLAAQQAAAAQGQASSLQQMLHALFTPMTKEEQEEIENLQKEHEIKIKAAKINIFKELPANIRQLIVDASEWKACHDKINATEVEKDPRLVELEAKKNNNHGFFGTSGGTYVGGLQMGGSTITTTTGSWLTFQPFINLPDGLTVEDIKNAHMEATLEEEMLKSETNP